MENQDINQIKQIVDNSIETSINSLVKDVIKPSFEHVFERLDRVEGRLDGVEGRLDKVEEDISDLKADVRRLPDKDYLDKKLFELKGDLVFKFQQQEKKINFLVSILKRNNLISFEEEKRLKEFDIYPFAAQLN
jgi:hypothetical protein